MATESVLCRNCQYQVDCGDNLGYLQSLPRGCVTLCITSPPYEDARTYGLDFNLAGQKWVDWMIPRVVEMCRVTAGLVCVNMAGKVAEGSYSPVVEWLVADLTRHHDLVCGPAPYVYFRFGIPGSGSKRYHRRDWEPVYCFARPEVLPLAWTDNTAMGHPPKWAPGGKMSHRVSDGSRVNQWGGHETSGSQRRQNGTRQRPGRPSHKVVTRPREGQHSQESTKYSPPALANPGNVVREKYDAEEVRQLLEQFATREIDQGDVIRCLVGGGHMGSRLAHESEAPFSETLVEFFVRSYAPPDSIVLDPFCGSGTVGAVALSFGRRFLGCDIRASQVEIVRARLATVTPLLPGLEEVASEGPH